MLYTTRKVKIIPLVILTIYDYNFQNFRFHKQVQRSVDDTSVNYGDNSVEQLQSINSELKSRLG